MKLIRRRREPGNGPMEPGGSLLTGTGVSKITWMEVRIV